MFSSYLSFLDLLKKNTANKCAKKFDLKQFSVAHLLATFLKLYLYIKCTAFPICHNIERIDYKQPQRKAWSHLEKCRIYYPKLHQNSINKDKTFKR